MNKKVLSAILFSALFAGTGTFTSCIDTDEPEGITNLRGAKAELIRAKVAVEAANAAYVQAEATLKLAEASYKDAETRWKLAEAAKEEALAAQEAARTEEEKARIALQIAKWENEMKEIALDIQESLANKQAALAKAQFELETALKQIEVAKQLGLSSLDEAKISSLQELVKTAYKKVYGEESENGLGGLVGQVYDAEKDLYDAMMDKAAGLDSKGDQTLYIPELELAVARAEADVEAEKESLTKLNEFLAKDAETTDWRAEIAELEDSVKLLDKAISEKGVEISKAENSPEAIAAKQAWEGVVDENGKVVKNGTKQELADAKKEYNKYAVGGKEAIELTLSKIEVAPVAELVSIVDDAVNAYNADAERPVALWDGQKFLSEKVTYNQPKYGTEVTEATYKPAGILAEVEAWIGALDKAIVSANDTALAKLTLAAAEQRVLDADTLNMEAIEMWEVALNAMKGVATPVPTDYVSEDETVDADIAGAVVAYNTAVGALSTAVETYNTTFAATVESEFNKIKNDDFEIEYKNMMVAELTALGYTGFPTSGVLYTVSNLESVYASSDLLDDAGKKAENDKKAATKKKAQAEAAKHAIDNEEAWTTQATTKALAADAVKNAKDAITNTDPTKGAVAAVKKVYGELSTVLGEYETLANDIYAQKLTADKAKVNFEVATGVGAEVTVGSAKHKVLTDEWVIPNGNSYVVLRTAISDENYGKIIATELDKLLAETALETTSNVVFGMGEKRAVAPTEAEIRAYAEKNSVDLNTCGTYGAYLAAQDEVTSIKNKIAAVEKLAEVKAAVADAKTALEAEIAANEAQFAELHAAVIAADAANIAAENAYKAVTDEITLSLKIEEAKLNANKDAIKSVLDELTNAVNNHLGIDGVTYDYDSFEDDLKTAVENAEDAVIAAEKNLLLAEKDLQLAKEGKYDAVATAQRNLDAANAALAKAMEEYQEALTNLETALAIMAGEAE